MSGSFGNILKISIFGESHGTGIGITIDGIEPGFEICTDEIDRQMARRAPGSSDMTTSRREPDKVEILSGVFEGRTTGAPICAVIRNTNTRSTDYARTKDIMRPSHADYTGYIKYRGFADYRGGGHFSGRITAPLVFCGALVCGILKQRGIDIFSHIQSVGKVKDSSFSDINIGDFDFYKLSDMQLPLLNNDCEEKIKQEILSAKQNGDSVGGVVECMAVGIPTGVGEPFFDSVESILSHLLFSVPAVKGVEFGDGFKLAEMLGSKANDAMCYNGDKISFKTNHNGGVLGGITNGMPIVLRAAVKPTPSISLPQDSVDINTKQNAVLNIKGRHDPCIVPRAVPVIESVMAIGIYDLLRRSGLWNS